MKALHPGFSPRRNDFLGRVDKSVNQLQKCGSALLKEKQGKKSGCLGRIFLLQS